MLERWAACGKEDTALQSARARRLRKAQSIFIGRSAKSGYAGGRLQKFFSVIRW